MIKFNGLALNIGDELRWSDNIVSTVFTAKVTGFTDKFILLENDMATFKMFRIKKNFHILEKVS